MSSDLTDDPLGRECIDERDLIRFWVAIAKEQAKNWHPAPCPERERE